MQIIVLGMHRSGTSALARILNLMGVYFGGEHVSTGRSDENVKGFWERRDVRDLNDDMLFNSRCDWDCVTNFALDQVPEETKSGYAVAAGDIVLNLDAHRPWFIKEPRLCLLFPIWRETLERPFCIHVLRNPLEVAHSLKARNNISIKAGLALWEVYSLHSLRASAGLRRVFISYEDLMENSSSVVEELHSALSEPGGYELRIPSGNELSHFLDDRLYRHRKTDRSLRSVATRSQLALFEALQGDKRALEAFSPPDPSRSSIETLKNYEKSIDVDQRIETARAARQQRTPEGAATQLKLRNLELEHARSLMEQASQRLSATEQEARGLRQTEIEVRTALARSLQKVENLASGLEQARMTSTQLEKERSALRDLNADLEKGRALLQQANAAIEENVAHLKHQRSDLEKSNADLERSKSDLERSNANLGKSNADLERSKSDLERSNADLGKSNADLERSKSDLERSKSDLERSNADLERSNADLGKSNADLGKSNADLERSNADLERSKSDLERSNADLERSNADLERSKSDLERSKSDLERSNADLERSNADLEKSKSDLERSNADLERSNADLERSKSDLERSNADLERSKSDLERSNADLEKSKSDLERSNADLEKSKSDLERSNADLERSKSDLERSKSDLERSKSDLERSNADLEKSKSDLERSNADLERSKSDLERSNADLERSKSDLEKSNADLERSKSDLERSNADLERSNADLERSNADLERSNADLEEANSELQAGLTVADQAAAELREDIEARTRELAALVDTNATLLRDIAAREQTNLALNEEADDLRLERSLLQQANAQLEERGAVIEQSHARAVEDIKKLESDKANLDARLVKIERDHAGMVTRLGRVGDEVARRRSRARYTVALWDRELDDRRRAAAELTRIASGLGTDIASLLGSRRWRLGRAIVSGLHFLSFRGIPKDVGERLSVANAGYQAKAQLMGDFATSRDDLPQTLADLVPTTATSIDEMFDSAPRRHAELTLQLLERGLELKRRARQIEEMSAHVDALASIFEGMVRSWRWRIGNLLISSPYRLLRKTPPTAADSAVALVKRYRSGTHAEVARRPVIPLPPEDDAAVAGGFSGGTSSGTAPINDRIEHATLEAPEKLVLPARPSIRPNLPNTSVDIVVCVHDALEDVKRCLASVLSRTAIVFRLIVVNDGSSPETTAWLRRLAARHSVIQLIETDGPLGYTRAANRGLRASSAAHVVLLNSDTIVPRLWVESMLECLLTNDEVGIVGPLSNAASWQSIPERIDEDGNWAVNDLPAGFNVDEYSELVHRTSERAFPRVAFLNGFCLLIRREVVRAIGHLDENAFPRGYGEENDFCIRARAAGFQLAIADQCFVYHAKSRSFGDETRNLLAEEGRRQLERKHGKEFIEQGTGDLKQNPDLARIRSRVSSLVTGAAEGGFADPTSDRNGDRLRDDMRVLFVLPVRGGSGGANSVVQEVAGMRSLGVDARVAIDARHARSMHRFYADVLDPDSRIVFASNEDLVSIAARFDVIVATLWSTPALIAPIAERWPEKAYAYYVQDYEPWFFPNDPDSRSSAFDSYTRVPSMVLMAKTDWICRTVREHHGVEVFRVAPSLDHEVFYPAVRPDGDAVTLAAMIRPSTPRRAPLRTLRVLSDLALRFERLRILLFGCEADALEDLARRSEPQLTLDFAFENRGVLTRRDVADLLREADIFLDLSDYQAFGRTGLEAMACGCATVLPARGGVDEYVVDGENAFLVDTSSFTEMTSTIARLITDLPMRETLRQRSLATAARYSVIRASLSELSVFRWAWTVGGNNRFRGDAYRRGVDPPVQAQRAMIAVHTGFDGQDGIADDATQHRVLRPLQHPALKNAVSVVEVQSAAAIQRCVPDVCVVHNALQATIAEAEEVVRACHETGAALVYSGDRQAEHAFRDGTATAASVFAQSACRVVASTEVVGRSLEDSGRPVNVVPAALDETIWLGRSVLGESTRADLVPNGVVQVLFIGSDDELGILLPALVEVNKDGHRVEVTAVGDFTLKLPTYVEPMSRREQSYDDFVAGLRARNHWDAAVLPVTEASVDADVRFLGLSALRLAIVCSNWGDHTRFVRDTENSLTVPNTRSGWRDGLSRLVVDPELLQRLRDQALYDVENKHSLRRCWANFRQAYVQAGAA